MLHKLVVRRHTDTALRDAIAPLIGKIDIAAMREANLRAAGSASPTDVARWLSERISGEKPKQ